MLEFESYPERQELFGTRAHRAVFVALRILDDASRLIGPGTVECANVLVVLGGVMASQSGSAAKISSREFRFYQHRRIEHSLHPVG